MLDDALHTADLDAVLSVMFGMQTKTMRYSLCIAAAVALLAGCAGSQMLSPGSNPGTADAGAVRSSKAFHYKRGHQSFIVPAGVTQIEVDARGAQGGFACSTITTGCSVGGLGAKVKAWIPVTPGEKLAILVGGAALGNGGGFNGGGAGGSERSPKLDGYGGGGASDIRQNGDALTDRIVVAGGGGGSGGFTELAGAGGPGGGTVGGSGSEGDDYGGVGGYGGSGGSQYSGGSGGAGGYGTYGPGNSGNNGSPGRGGRGGHGCKKRQKYCAEAGGGGGGGGGYYGGGGGGSGGAGQLSEAAGGGGGGGGSSYVEPNATLLENLQGAAPAGNGEVIFSWTTGTQK